MPVSNETSTPAHLLPPIPLSDKEVKLNKMAEDNEKRILNINVDSLKKYESILEGDIEVEIISFSNLKKLKNNLRSLLSIKRFIEGECIFNNGKTDMVRELEDLLEHMILNHKEMLDNIKYIL